MEAKKKTAIALNFLSIDNQDFKIKIYRRECSGDEKSWNKSIKKYKLPDQNGTYRYYWVSFDEFENSRSYIAASIENINLTKYYLFTLLEKKLRDVNIKFHQREKERRFAPYRLYITIEETKYGEKAIWMEPYYLKAKQKFGFLIDFKFLKDPIVPFNKDVQKLSLSLDENYRSNTGYHIDKYRYIRNFIENYLSNFKCLTENITILSSFTILEYKSLSPREFIFRGDKENTSQFKGISEHGPYELQHGDHLKYIYLFYREHKGYAIELVKALNGEKFVTFNGVKKLGLPEQKKENTFSIQINSFGEIPISKLDKIDNQNTVLIAIIPEKEEKFYYTLKHYCLKRNIPLQIVNFETVIDDNKLKWSIAGIALQILAKVGGVPWIVKAKNSDCLIMGIGQSIEKNDNNEEPKRFFAYSVLLESSGKFLTIEPIADAKDKKEYLKKITEKIPILIQKYRNYNKIVFHVPEKIPFEIVKEIEKSLAFVNRNIELYIIRINDDSKFFGYDINNNSLIPYEGSYIQLSHKEFLVWAEGLSHKNPTPKKRYSNPIYVEFYYSNQKNIDYGSFLQDIINLAGANYRGFNAKSLPVSIYYPKLISKFNKNFKRHNLEIITEKKDKMWFL